MAKKTRKCPDCKGKGVLAVNLPRMLGLAASQSTMPCGKCHGSKKVDVR